MSDADFYSREYNNRELFPDHPKHFARWQEASARARGTMTCYLDRAYGPTPAETLDIFPARKGDGSALVFIHGGYWRSLDKRDFSYLAPAWVDAGVSLVVVNYGLCPAVSIERIVQQMVAASAWLYRHAADYGMDGVVLSNHGGRYLDSAPAPLQVVPEVRRAVGDRLKIIIDSGARRGSSHFGAQSHCVLFRLLPHSGQRPRQASSQSGFIGSASTNCSRNNSIRSTRPSR